MKDDVLLVSWGTAVHVHLLFPIKVISPKQRERERESGEKLRSIFFSNQALILDK